MKCAICFPFFDNKGNSKVHTHSHSLRYGINIDENITRFARCTENGTWQCSLRMTPKKKKQEVTIPNFFPRGKSLEAYSALHNYKTVSFFPGPCLHCEAKHDSSMSEYEHVCINP